MEFLERAQSFLGVSGPDIVLAPEGGKGGNINKREKKKSASACVRTFYDKFGEPCVRFESSLKSMTIFKPVSSFLYAHLSAHPGANLNLAVSQTHIPPYTSVPWHCRPAHRPPVACCRRRNSMGSRHPVRRAKQPPPGTQFEGSMRVTTPSSRYRGRFHPSRSEYLGERYA